jgi:NodT family efflux transporter outer membrane factor (OMF) lipoprotein
MAQAPLAAALVGCRNRGGGRMRSARMSIRRVCGLAALSVAGLLSAACKVGPNYHRPDALVPGAYKELPPGWKLGAPRDGEDRGEWWRVFEDPQLNELEGQVNISNQNVKQYEAEYRQAAALLKEAEASLYPTLTVNFEGQRGGGGGGTAAVSSAVGSGVGGTTHTEFTLEGLLSWQPDLWGTIRRQVESRKAGVQVSEANLANARLSAQATLATDYFDLRAADSLRKLLAQSVCLDQRALEITQNMFNSGTATNGDVAAAQAALEAAQAQLAAVDQQRGTFEHAIATLTGHLPSELAIPEAPLATTVPDVPVSLPSELLERNPSIAAAERQMRQENALIGVAIGAYFPTISLTGLGGYSGNPLSILIRRSNRIWSAGGTASDTLFQGGQQVAAVAVARANYDQYVATYRQTVLSSFQSIEDQLLALRVLKGESEFASRAVDHAQVAVNVAMNQFSAGTVSYTTVITDIQAWLADQESLLTIRQNELVADVSLIEALGGGWDTSRL